ncbi:alanine racemase [Demequina litorisediminis]|uniref:Alanine racemase N-terminal domain-containing protein n=1 Tax=Demequina litorisediminis TaxID=1849022 RepID=A0ABQ6IC64_9MICO|nr:alanine racemase [Demequina litorisediminis]GMA35330.1 hypothetical protein GCM10025876_15340 [Demequina litorisediminis]
MFLELTRRRNPALIRDAVALHRAGLIPPNTSVIDLDAVGRNADACVAEAAAHGLTPFAMTKQIGRNPDVSAALVRHGITHAVGVDLECAIAARAGGLATGHLGHLVQIPRHSAAAAAALEPAYWTVFSLEKAREAGAASVAAGREQPVLARIHAEGDRFYRGHEGGFDAASIVEVADQIDAIDGVRFAGITSFPATLFDAAAGAAVSTPNLATLTRAKEALLASGRDHVEAQCPRHHLHVDSRHACRSGCHAGRARARAHGHHAASRGDRLGRGPGDRLRQRGVPPVGIRCLCLRGRPVRRPRARRRTHACPRGR